MLRNTVIEKAVMYIYSDIDIYNTYKRVEHWKIPAQDEKPNSRGELISTIKKGGEIKYHPLKMFT